MFPPIPSHMSRRLWHLDPKLWQVGSTKHLEIGDFDRLYPLLAVCSDSSLQQMETYDWHDRVYFFVLEPLEGQFITVG